VILLILSFLGVNILLIIGGFIKWLASLFQPLVDGIWSVFGYTTGNIINKSADAVSNVAKTGIDIADGTAHSIGNLLKDSANINGELPLGAIDISPIGQSPSAVPAVANSASPLKNPIPSLDKTLNESPIKPTMPNNLQTEGSWCYIGDFQGERGCIQVDNSSNCMSKQLYPNKPSCVAFPPPPYPSQPPPPSIGHSQPYMGIPPPPPPVRPLPPYMGIPPPLPVGVPPYLGRMMPSRPPPQWTNVTQPNMGQIPPPPYSTQPPLPPLIN